MFQGSLTTWGFRTYPKLKKMEKRTARERNNEGPSCQYHATKLGLTLPNVLHRSNVHMSSTYNIIHNSKYENSTIA
jgi:5-methylcytosine-specific restriction endonuclease McrA